MADSTSQSPTSSVVNSIAASAEEESVEAPAENSATKKEEADAEPEKKQPAENKAPKDGTKVETMTSLPAIITDEEGVSIPEAANGEKMYSYRYVQVLARVHAVAGFAI